MNVLVTGSSGYIGSVLCELLYEQDHRVLGCDNNLLAPDPESVMRNLRISFDHDFVIHNILLYNVDVIFHLAATSTVGPDAEDPLRYLENNTAKTITFLHKLAEAGWKGHFVFASTAAVYQLQDVYGKHSKPLGEFSHTTSQDSIYGTSKMLCEKALYQAQKYGINVTTFRFFNVAGAYKHLGEEAEDTHLLSRLCSNVLSNTPTTVYGNDYLTTDGTCVRDYVHVVDICEAMIWAVEGEHFGTFNLGLGKGVSVKQMIEQFEMHTGQTVKYNSGPRRPGDAPYLIADPGLFMRQTGFSYKYSLRDIINSTWEHYKNGI
jgi:UDP-glucose 4-epimerase